MFGLTNKYVGEAMIEGKGGNIWYKYYLDDKGRIVIDKGKGCLYFPIGPIFVRNNGMVRKVNYKGEIIKELDEINLLKNIK